MSETVVIKPAAPVVLTGPRVSINVVEGQERIVIAPGTEPVVVKVSDTNPVVKLSLAQVSINIPEVVTDTFVEGVVLVEAGETLGGHRVAYIAPDGKAYYAGSDLADSIYSVGLTLGAYSPTEDATLVTAGVVKENSWNWTPGAALYIGLLGQLTEVEPASGFVKVFAVAVSSTTISILNHMGIQLSS